MMHQDDNKRLVDGKLNGEKLKGGSENLTNSKRSRLAVLDLIEFPLDGLSLIEASAGTGKTYALANLYLRYLLEKKFTVDQILVVTFTEAATQELKDRIRRRIRELGALFDLRLNAENTEAISEQKAEQKAEQKIGSEQNADKILEQLYKASRTPELDRLRLKIAERQMDQAEIHTIHGFCQQLLHSHALDSKLPLQQHLLEDQKLLHLKVIENFWRQQVLTLEPHELKFICSKWPAPANLLQSILPLLKRPPEQIFPTPKSKGIQSWQESYQEAKHWFVLLKQETVSCIDDVEALIVSSDLKRVKDKQNWLQIIRAWSEQETVDFSFPSKGNRTNLFKDFVPENLVLQTKAKGETPAHAYFEFLERHLSCAPVPLQFQFIVQTYQVVSKMVEREKREQRALSFDDLISSVSNALKNNPDEQADLVNPLAEQVRAQYQVALIDEFQDTDKTQYHIFSTLFGVLAENESKQVSSRLVLIGDPKQAIYAFRGGDISTYLQAKKDIANHTQGNIFTMDTNWRSSEKMVLAVNTLFSGLDNAFRADDIPFTVVKAAKKIDTNAASPALCITQLSSSDLNKEQIASTLADQCVQQISRLMSDKTMSDELKPDKYTTVKSSDIAILVRSGAEGELIKRRLASVGLSASMEGKSSIYNTTEARAIYFLLLAVSEPNNEYAVRRCLAEPFYGVSDEKFRQFNEQISVLSAYLQSFEILQRRWQQAGVLAMIRSALTRLNVYDYWTGLVTKDEDLNSGTAVAWERSLSNINQLAELLQNQSRTYRSNSALIRWLRDSISSAENADDESKLRLESDEQLIRIVTIHKSKGLEYPFVFIPFLFSGRGADEAWYYDETPANNETTRKPLTLDLLKETSHLVQADSERLSEDIRLLYVAITRAKYRCYIGTAAYKGTGKKSLSLADTAWAYLLFHGTPPSPLDDDILSSCLESFALNHSECIEILSLDTNEINRSGLKNDADTKRPLSSDGSKRDQNHLAFNLQAKTLQHRIENDWRVQSFTGLMHENQARNVHHSSAIFLSKPLSGLIDIFSFPRGSRAGTFLHRLFESIVFESGEPIAALKTRYPTLEALILSQLGMSKLVEEHELAPWSHYLQHWVQQVLRFPLNVLQKGLLNKSQLQGGQLQGGQIQNCPSEKVIRLGDLSEKHYFSEMAFYFSVNQLKSRNFNKLLHDFGHYAADIDFSSFEGHLKGAIDLVFKANNQYFILDYKSNYLGDSIEDYRLEALQVAMDEHRYDVQYIIYTLATHRYLKHRLGESYDYQRDFGGVYYLFLRGLALKNEYDEDTNIPQQDMTGVVFIKPEFALIDALDRQLSEARLASL